MAERFDLYGPFYRRLFSPAWERLVRQRPTLAHWKELERTQWLPLDELREIQLRKLRALVAHAYDHVPFYRRRFDEAGVGRLLPSNLEELRQLPLMRRSDAQASFEERASTQGPAVAITKTTGGSTGEPLRFGYEIESEHHRTAVKLRGYGWAGHRPGDRTLHYWGVATTKRPGRLASTKLTLDRGLRRELWIDCNDRDEAQLAAVADAIERHRPSHLVCYTQAGVDLAHYLVDRGAHPLDLTVICGAERLHPHDRRVLARAFSGRVYETYGCREVMLIASECEHHDGLHESMENVVVEIVVTERGKERAARPGELGEVVLTDLHNYAMPFIRYANGDLAVAGPLRPCACGRGLARIASVEGRVTDTLRDGHGHPVDGMVFNLMFSPIADQVRQFRAVQHVDGSITLQIVPARTLTESALAHLRRCLDERLHAVSVAIEQVASIPLSASGKRHPVVVERVASDAERAE